MYAEIRSDYICEDFTDAEGDILASISIDAWKTDKDSEEGEVIANVILTKSGDIITDWHDNAARNLEEVLLHINGAKERLSEIRKQHCKIDPELLGKLLDVADDALAKEYGLGEEEIFISEDAAAKMLAGWEEVLLLRKDQ